MAHPRIKLDLDSTDSLDFTREVSIPTPDGRALKIPFTYRYRDRVAMAALFDGFAASAKADADQPADTSNAAAVQAALDADVRTVLDIATGWGLEAPFDEANVRKLCIRYAGAATAILMDYRVSLTQGRLGN